MTTREKILDIAKDLIQCKGYNAFSFNDISKPLSVKNAAIHYHFPSKEILGCAVIDQERVRLCEWSKLTAHLDYIEQLDQFFGIYDNNLKNNRICMVGSLSSDYMAIPESMQQSLRIMVKEVTDWLTQLLEEGRKAQTFHFEGTAEDKASVVVTSLAAGLQIARVVGGEKFQKIKNQIKLDLTIN
ncbi:putative transcriptional regulator, TetR family [Fulvivirga imtechensis AK7]|uniref:Putative transcriptional regulator, TetR family n=1 Tax=Fulvivirga imtechensis AK7 TaxID=1237149 RepID=L8JVH5_9BACT|nr:TetR/AcrR family transcriptional regulator [Fulvivirga imtechensis]ELR72780.1 putative transcriptional regulator, TetR family [Fulvivirga imtechensis AK7]